jgi:hypothetical protein
MKYPIQAACNRQARMMLELSMPPVTPDVEARIEQTYPYLALALYRGLRQDKGLYTLTMELMSENPSHFLQET